MDSTAILTVVALQERDSILQALWQYVPFSFVLVADLLDLSVNTLEFYFPFAMEVTHVLMPWLPTIGYVAFLRLWWQRELQFRWKAGYWGD